MTWQAYSWDTGGAETRHTRSGSEQTNMFGRGGVRLFTTGCP